MVINDWYKPKISKFKKGYESFKVFHNTKMNILFHFLTSVLQIIFSIYFLLTFNFTYILAVIITPYITDGIGHKLEQNFGVVLLFSKVFKSTNSAGVNGFYNFLYRIMLFKEKFFKI
jgi:hypothetical protein